jgi:AcrR family transcriptional regulator
MGRLIDRNRKERAKKAKKERVAAILREARRSFLKLSYVEVTLDAIGRRAGVKKGIASMYFGSKEELYLKLLQEELEEWYEEIERGLASQPARLSNTKVARLLASSLADRKPLLRYLAQAAIVLEQNTEIMEAYRYHRWQRDRMVEVGEEMERRVADLAPGEGVRLLHRIQLIASGFQPYFDPRGSLAVNLIDPDFEDLRLDMEAEIEREVLQSLASKG